MPCTMSPNDLSEGLNELLGTRIQIAPQRRPLPAITPIGAAALTDHSLCSSSSSFARQCDAKALAAGERRLGKEVHVRHSTLEELIVRWAREQLAVEQVNGQLRQF